MSQHRGILTIVSCAITALVLSFGTVRWHEGGLLAQTMKDSDAKTVVEQFLNILKIYDTGGVLTDQQKSGYFPQLIQFVSRQFMKQQGIQNYYNQQFAFNSYFFNSFVVDGVELPYVYVSLNMQNPVHLKFKVVREGGQNLIMPTMDSIVEPSGQKWINPWFEVTGPYVPKNTIYTPSGGLLTEQSARSLVEQFLYAKMGYDQGGVFSFQDKQMGFNKLLPFFSKQFLKSMNIPQNYTGQYSINSYVFQSFIVDYVKMPYVYVRLNQNAVSPIYLKFHVVQEGNGLYINPTMDSYNYGNEQWINPWCGTTHD